MEVSPSMYKFFMPSGNHHNVSRSAAGGANNNSTFTHGNNSSFHMSQISAFQDTIAVDTTQEDEDFSRNEDAVEGVATEVRVDPERTLTPSGFQSASAEVRLNTGRSFYSLFVDKSAKKRKAHV